MTDYTKTTDFAAKDSLPSGDSGKIIKGTEFETEFDNIATAIATKSNIASPTFTGTTTIPTVDINGGAIDAVTLGTNSAVTEAQVDNININGNTISSSDTNGNVNISPNGTGTVVINTDLDVDNINVNGNAIISTNTNGNIDLTPNGTGEVNISKVDIDSGAIDGTVIGAASAAAITGTTITGTSFVTSGNMTFGDNDKAVFGAGSDLEIYHDGTGSYIDEKGTGDLYIRSNGNNLRLQNYGGENFLRAVNNGTVEIYYDDSKKLATTSTGIDVTGTVTADGLTVDGDITVNDASPSISFFDTDGTNQRGQVRQVSDRIIVSARNNTAYGSIYFTGQDASTEINRMIIDGPTGDISFYEDTGTTAKLFWDASAESLGIGTSSPSALLEVATPSSGSAAVFNLLDNTADGFVVKQGSNEYISVDTTNAAEVITLGNTTTIADVIIPAGSVGIGTTTPGRLLELKESSTGAGDAIIRLRGHGNDANNTPLGSLEWFNTDPSGDQPGVVAAIEAQSDNPSGHMGKLLFKTHDGSEGGEGSSPVERMRITSSGNVGIGRTPLSKKLEVEGTTSNYNTILVADSASGTTGTGGGIGFQSDNGAGVSVLVAAIQGIKENSTSEDQSGALVFAVKSPSPHTMDEAMRIDSSGNLLVGTTDSSPYTTLEGFVVALNNGTKSAACFGADNVASRTVVNIVNPNGQVGSITTNASATAYNTSSDQRLKDNIVDAPSASDDIDAIQVRSFDWKADGSHQKYGMVAQELVIVAPNAVSQPEDPEEMMGVDYSKLVPMLIKEVQQLRARVAQLEGAN